MSLSRDPENPSRVPLKDPNGHVLACMENGILVIRNRDGRESGWHICRLMEIAMLQLSMTPDIIESG